MSIFEILIPDIFNSYEVYAYSMQNNFKEKIKSQKICSFEFANSNYYDENKIYEIKCKLLIQYDIQSNEVSAFKI